jgi:3-isopropylmalate/(R)-2-methylmalate dehydratase large subunit
MAGKNVIQKILARSVGKPSVETGDFVHVRSNCITTVGGDGDGRGLGQLDPNAKPSVFDPQRIGIVVGHAGAGGMPRTAGNHRRKMRQWAETVGVPRENIFDLGSQGVEHVIAGEQAWALPGEVYLSIVDGHTTALGALGGFAVALSYGAAEYITKGYTWIEVPPVARITLTGRTKPGVFARDVYEYVLGQIGPNGTPSQVIVWDGDYVRDLDMDARFTLCANALFSSAWTNIIEPDDVTLDYVRTRTNKALVPLYGDADAEYEQQLRFDVSDIEPQVVPPPERHRAAAVSKHAGLKISKAHIGTCANGRYEDLKLAAMVLKGRKIHPDVMLNITAGSTAVYRRCLDEGLIGIFMDAGVFLPPASCGMCAGGKNTPLADGDVCISSGTCNYPGRMGSSKADIYLASPATVAASAVTGEITDPRQLL